MASTIPQYGINMKKRRKRKKRPFKSKEEAHSYGRAQGYLTYLYEMAVKMRDSKDFDLNSIAKYSKLSIKTILVL
jgi:hypothetical protein